MREEKLIISNFRSWKGDNYVDLASINLLLGSNSSGKSSIIHALSLLRQSEPSLRLIPKGAEIDLGRIQDQVNFQVKSQSKRDTSEQLGFGLRSNVKERDLQRLARLDYSYRRSHLRRLNGPDAAIPRVQPNNLLRQSETEQLEGIATQLGSLEYIERYDDLGLITQVILSSRKHPILILDIKKLPRSKLQIKMTITNNPKYWDIFIDLSGATEANNSPDEYEEENIRKNLDLLESDLKSARKKLRGMTRAVAKLSKNIVEETEEIDREKVTNAVLAKHSNDQAQQVLKARRDVSLLQRGLAEESKKIRRWIIPGKDNVEKCSYLAQKISTSFTVDMGDMEDSSLYGHDNVVEYILRLFHNPQPMITPMRPRNKRSNLDPYIYVLDAIELLQKNTRGINVNPFRLLRLQHRRFTSIIKNVVRIGPHRERPDRITFVNPNDKSTFVGTKGENVMSIINQISPTQKKELNAWVTLLEIPYTLDAKFDKKFNISQLILIDSEGMSVSLADVGYGIGQVLPIILTSMLLKDTLITIEQPELHLHPKLQANLADLFLKSASQNNNAFILETHSEHIILRIKRRQKEIREGTIDPIKRAPRRTRNQIPTAELPEWVSVRDSIVISVVENKGNKSESYLTKITLNSDGEFDTLWPGDFFPERYVELGLEDEL